MEEIYLDYQTTTPPRQESLNALFSSLENEWGSTSSFHRLGDRQNLEYRNAISQIYKALSIEKDHDFVFTSSGVEAINHAIFATYLHRTQTSGRNHFVTSQIDEAGIMMSLNRLQEHFNCSFSMTPVDQNGMLSVKAIAEAITPRTALVCISWACGLTGVIHPIEEIASLCYERGIWLLIDASHVIGKLDINFEESKIDFLTFNGDHLFAPKGTGGLFAKKEKLFNPFILGGNEQMGLRGGSLNLGGLKALSLSLDFLKEKQNTYSLHIASLRDLFEKRILESIPGSKIFFEESERLPHISCIYFPKVSQEALAFLLNERGVYVCYGGGIMQQLSHRLIASSVSSCEAHSALSFGLSHLTELCHLEKAIAIIQESYQQLFRFSQYLTPLDVHEL